MTQYEFKTRKPTGKPAWPFLLLAGAEQSGKSWAWAEFSASDLVGRTYVIPVGEIHSDEYGAIPGADFLIVEHDGSYNGIVNATWAATKQPRVDGKPNCIVIDSATLIWDMLSAEQQAVATRRERIKQEKARQYGNRAPRTKPADEGGPVITMDQWNVAKSRWYKLVDLLRKHDGPVIVTARLEEVTVMDKDGKPTTDKTMKVRAEKNLPFDVSCIVEMPRRREAFLTGVKSVRLQLEPGKPFPLPDFKIANLFAMLGLDAHTEVSAREYVPLSVDTYLAEESAANGWDQPSQDARQATERPAGNQQASTPPTRPQGTEQAARPAGVGVDPQVVNDFIGEMEQLQENDLAGWRAAFQQAKQLGIMHVEIPTGQGERTQLGAYLMAAGRHASTLPQSPEGSASAQQESAAGGDPRSGTPGEVAVTDLAGSATVAAGQGGGGGI